MKKFISIVIATYNCADDLTDCLESIIECRSDDIEILIADGGSTDETIDIIKKYSSKISWWCSENDDGIYDAFNKAIRHTSADWVMFLGADDRIYERNTISLVRERLKLIPHDVELVYCKVCFINLNNTQRLLGKPWCESKKRLKSFMTIPHQGVLHKRTLFEKFGLFDSALRFSSDYKLMLLATKTSTPVFFGDIVLSVQGGGGISSLRQNRCQILREFRDIQRELGYRIEVAWAIAYIKALFWLILYHIGINVDKRPKIVSKF